MRKNKLYSFILIVCFILVTIVFGQFNNLVMGEEEDIIIVDDSAKKDDKVDESPVKPDDLIDDKNEGNINIKKSKYKGLADLLIPLGIIDSSFKHEDVITRKEFAVMICKILGLEEVAQQATTPFSDVPESDPASGSIKTVSNMGIIKGYEDGSFRPEAQITYEQAIKMLVSVLGYDLKAQQKGGYPAGYLIVASEIGLLKSIEGKIGEPVKGSLAEQLIYNSLHIDIMEHTGFGATEKYSIIKDKTLLSARLNIKKGEGILKATHQTGLNAESKLRKGEVQIDDTIYKVGETDAESYLGYQVTYYAKKDALTDEYTILHLMLEEGKNYVLTVMAEDISPETTDKKFMYWENKDSDDREKEVTITRATDMVYNDKAHPSFTVQDLKPKSGKVVLIDRGNDGQYDVIIITAYQTIVVDRILEHDNKIFDKYSPTNNLVLEEDTTNYTYKIIKDGNEISISDLTEWDILSVTKSKDGKLITIQVTNNKVTGTVTEKNLDEIKIGEKNYKIANSYLESINTKNANEISLNDSTTFYLDIEGKIAAVDYSYSLGINYAYLYQMSVSNNLDKKVEFKMFNSKGQWVTYELEKKVEFNRGQVRMDAMDVANHAKISNTNGVIKQLITYKLNSEGKISSIDTATEFDYLNASTTAAQNQIQKDAQIVALKNGDFTKSKGNKNLMVYRALNKAFMHFKIYSQTQPADVFQVYLNNDTIIMFIPKDPSRTQDYSIKSTNELAPIYYTIASYNESEYNASPIIVIQEDTVNNTSYSNPTITAKGIFTSLLLVDKVANAVNNDGEIIQKLYGVVDNKEVEMITSEDGLLGVLNKGDVVQINTNSSGEIIGKLGKEDVIHINKNSGGNIVMTDGDNQNIIPSAHPLLARVIVCGEVCDINSNIKKMIVKDTTGVKRTYSLDYAKLTVSLYDKKTQKTSVSSIDKIQEGDVVLMRMVSAVIRDVIVFRF